MLKQMFVFAILLLPLLGCTAPATTADPSTTENETSAEEPESVGSETSDERTAASGTLTFTANGEDFVRQGFVSKDGWAISFDNLYVTLTDVAAYQTDPPYDAESGDTPEGTEVALDGTYTLDLAAGDENAAPILIETVADAPTGQFNALSWRMVPATEGDASGSTLVLDGMAEKAGETVDFVMRIDHEYAYTCGEYIGDERKGIVTADEEANLEATFHFDHIFGDGDAPADDSLNVGALGFDPLAAVATDGALDVTIADLEATLSPEDFETLQDTLSTLGHVGEGHCYEATGGYTGAHGGE